MPRRHIPVLEWLAFSQMRQTGSVVVLRVGLWIVTPDPASNLEEANICLLATGLDCCNVDVV